MTPPSSICGVGVMSQNRTSTDMDTFFFVLGGGNLSEETNHHRFDPGLVWFKLPWSFSAWKREKRDHAPLHPLEEYTATRNKMLVRLPISF